VADRYSRHRLVIATQTASLLLAFALAALTLSGAVRVWHIFVLSALLGVVNSFDIPARQAFIVGLVAKPDLMNAIALNSSIFNGARIIGPAIAGVLVAAIGEGWCFMANAVSYIAVIAGLLMIRTVPRPRPRPTSSPLSHILEGFVFVWRTGPVHTLLALLGFVGLVGMPYSVLMPVFAGRILQGGARTLGLLLGATGVGALAGALSIAARRGVKGLGRWVALSCSAFGLGLIVFSASRQLWLSMAVLVPVGFSMMVQMASSNTLIQTMVPDELRGRVMAVYSMTFLGMAPFGALLAGAAADRLGAPLTVALGGAVSVVGAGVFWSRWPALRVAARELIVAQQMAGGDPAEEITAAPPSELSRNAVADPDGPAASSQ
jgi:MFS family permease